MIRVFLLFFLTLLSTSILLSQDDLPIRNNNPSRDTVPDTLMSELEFESADTSHIFYFYEDNPYHQYPFNDTLLDNRLSQYDPTRQQTVDYFMLGNLGSAHYPIFYDAYDRQGFDVGMHQFDLYKINELKYYILENSYSEAYYSQGAAQEDAYFKANLGRQFANGINFSLNYKRINNVGLYRRAKSRNTALALGMWIHRPRYDGFITYTNNVIQQQDNGGVETDTLFDEPNFQQRANIPVFLETANTRHAQNSISYNQHYKLRKTNDSLGVGPKRNFRINHKITYQTVDYKFDDESVLDDSVYYGQQLVDSRGLRQYIGANNLTNYLGLSTFKSANGTETKLQQNRDNFEVGIKHRVYFLNQEPEPTRKVNNLMLMGKFSYASPKGFNLEAYGHFCLWDNAGDYRINGALDLNLKKAGKLGIGLKQQRYAPSLVQTRNYISQVLTWDNNFARPIETKLSATYEIPIVKIDAEANYHLINKPIYFDTLATPQQFDGAVNIVQFLFKKNFTYGKWHLDNTVALQSTTADVIRVPNFFTKNSFYFEGLVFKSKAMLLRTGLDLRMASDFFVPSYSPVVSQFHLQDDQSQSLYPIVDFALSFKVTRFRGFLRIDNITSYVTDRVYYGVHLQPLYESNFRLGVTWRFSG